MSYMGKVRPTIALTSSDIVDGAITTDKVVDDAVTADKVANAINTSISANTAKVTNATHTGDVTGATALTIAVDAVDIAMLSATGTADSTTFLRGDNAWTAVPSNADYVNIQRVTSSFSGDATPISGYTDAGGFDPNGYGAMSESTGIFTFPTTGIYKVQINAWADKTASDGAKTAYFQIFTTPDDTNYTAYQYAQFIGNTSNYDNQGIYVAHLIFDVTNTSTHKCKVHFDTAGADTNVRIRSGASSNETYVTFTRLGAT